MAQTWLIPRSYQDQLSYESHRKAAAAWEEGFYNDLVVEFLVPGDHRFVGHARPVTQPVKQVVFDEHLQCCDTKLVQRNPPTTDHALHPARVATALLRRHQHGPFVQAQILRLQHCDLADAGSCMREHGRANE